jgi:hypothetical protein
VSDAAHRRWPDHRRGGRTRRSCDEAGDGTFRIDAPVVVLAGGALGTAEILLRNMDDDVVGRRLYINPHYFVWADMGRTIDNVTGIPCAYVVHGFRQVQHDAAATYAGGGYIMLTNHQSPAIAAVMLGGHGRRDAERMKRTATSPRHVRHRRGAPRPRVHRPDGIRRTEYNVRGVDQLKAVDYLKNATRIFLAAGAQEVWIPDVYGTCAHEADIDTKIRLRSVQPNAQFCAGSHLLGTAPWARTPRTRSPGRPARRTACEGCTWRTVRHCPARCRWTRH